MAKLRREIATCVVQLTGRQLERDLAYLGYVNEDDEDVEVLERTRLAEVKAEAQALRVVPRLVLEGVAADQSP